VTRVIRMINPRNMIIEVTMIHIPRNTIVNLGIEVSMACIWE